MTIREKILLRILIIITFICTFFIVTSIQINTHRNITSKIMMLKKEILSLKSIEKALPLQKIKLQALQNISQSNGNIKDKLPIYEIAEKYTKKMKKASVESIRSSITGFNDNEYLELNLRGQIESILIIIDQLSQEIGYRISSCRISMLDENGLSEVTIRLGHDAKD